MREINKIVIHCSDSPQGRGDDVETIRQWHTEAPPRGNGWRDIGYHWVILEDGIRQQGRPEWMAGAHVAGHNHDSIGICLIGIDDFTEAQMASLKYLVTGLLRVHPEATIYGHCDLDDNKTCPNFDVGEFIQELHS